MVVDTVSSDASRDLVFVNPRPADLELTRLYIEKTPADQSEFYAKTVSHSQIAEYDRILAELANLLPGRGRLLDLGCAAGYFMQVAARAGFDAHGIDLGTWDEQIASSRHVPNVRAVVLDAPALPTRLSTSYSSQVLNIRHIRSTMRDIHELRPAACAHQCSNYRCLSIVLGRDDELNTPPEHLTYSRHERSHGW
jgi:hypothetical protein